MDNEDGLSTQVPPLDSFNKPDWFLQLLIDICNKTDFSLSITLNVNGLLVTGNLIGGEKYFNGFANDLKMAGMPAEVTDLFKQFGDIYIKQKEQKNSKKDDETISPPQYIHLENARIFHPGGNLIPTNHGVWWRGRLDAIDGFILGAFSIDR